MTHEQLTHQALPEALFELPEWVDNEELRETYIIIVNNLRVEAVTAGLEMSTLDELQVERLASNYVYLRKRELTDDFSSGTDQKNLNEFFQRTLRDFRNQVQEARASAQAGNNVMTMLSALSVAVEDLPEEQRRSVLKRVQKELTTAASQ